MRNVEECCVIYYVKILFEFAIFEDTIFYVMFKE